MMNAIEKFNINAVDISEDESEATLVVEPLVRGYGITLGNSLRRVLLSSLPGYAITSVKIDNVLHELVLDTSGVRLQGENEAGEADAGEV